MKKMMIMPQRMEWNKASGEVSGSSQLCLCVCMYCGGLSVVRPKVVCFFFVFFSFWMGLKIDILKK